MARFLTNNGFACERLTPAIDQLVSINLPALVRAQAGGRMLWLALLSSENGRIRLSAREGETIETTRDAFREAYAWQALIPWQDPEPQGGESVAGPQRAAGRRNQEPPARA